MKASIKLREEEEKPPLLRAKVPISIFGLPFAASVTAGDPSDLGLHLLTSFPSFPSLKLSYHPKPATNPANPNPNPNPFTLTLNSGAGHLGSPFNSPLRISFHLSPNPNPTFSVTLKPQIGHVSLTKTAASSLFLNPDHPKENGGGVHHPIPVADSQARSGIDKLVSGGVGVRVTTAVPIGGRAGLKVRWAVKLPPEGTGPGVFGRLPQLTMDKISIERAEKSNEVEEEEGKKREPKEWSENDLEALRGMCFWMGKEAQVLKKESESIKESIEAVRKKFLEANERCRGKNSENVRNADAAAVRGSNGRFAAVGKRV